jgi:glycosyltransferase involved in cell wall biosynthesis
MLHGFYSCDYEYFHSLFESSLEMKRKRFPHRFIYVGRYYDFKGVREMWDAFIELKSETGTDWELWCLGTGDVEPVQHPAIQHFGFIQPLEMGKFIAEAGVFILPSRFEPWGVVVHEFASAGFPLLCSDAVGATEAFLKNGENGFSFTANDKNSIKAVMKKIMNLPDDHLLQMGERSVQLAANITPSKWADTIMHLVNEK